MDLNEINKIRTSWEKGIDSVVNKRRAAMTNHEAWTVGFLAPTKNCKSDEKIRCNLNLGMHAQNQRPCVGIALKYLGDRRRSDQFPMGQPDHRRQLTYIRRWPS